MNELLRAAGAVLLWPGLTGGALLAWLYLWAGRKLAARLQGRQGPPFYQPFFDWVKLMGKSTLVPGGVDRRLFYGLPLVAVASLVAALTLIPVPGNPLPGFGGDLILLLYLLEMPALCTVVAGYASRSIYGQVSAAREAVFALGYNLPFLASTVALAIHARSLTLAEIARTPAGLAGAAAALAFLLALPGRLKSNPFSIPNAEQEILAGALTEYNGAPLALFELAHGLELVALAELFAALFLLPGSGPLGNRPLGGGISGLVVYLILGVALTCLLTLLATATARLKISQAFRLYWRWGAAAGVVAIGLSLAL